MKTLIEFLLKICMIPVLITIVLSPVWVLSLGFYCLFADMKNEGTTLLAGVIGFVFSYPYSLFAKPVVASLGIFSF